MPPPRSPVEWARAIRDLASRAPAPGGPSPFEVDWWLRADLEGHGSDGGGNRQQQPEALSGVPLDLRLWALAVAPAGLPHVSVASLVDLSGAGPLAPDLRVRGIEVWTETELCALHALDALALRTGEAAIATRCDRAVAWLLREIQPDNATNLPWAAQVFVRRWCERGDEPALLYAQAQLHACRVSLGVPDARSALILRHAAMLLDALPGQQ